MKSWTMLLIGSLVAAALIVAPRRAAAQEDKALPKIPQRPEIQDEDLKPASLKVTRATPQPLKWGPQWTSLPRFMQGATVHQPDADATAELEMEVLADGIAVIAASCWVPMRTPPEIEAKVTTQRQLYEQGWIWGGNLERIGIADGQLELMWRPCKAGERFVFHTRLDTAPVAFEVTSKGLRGMLHQEIPEEYQVPIEHRLPSLSREMWDYDPIDFFDVLESPTRGEGLFSASSFDGDSLVCHFPQGSRCKLVLQKLFCDPPPEYDLELVATRIRGEDGLYVGLVSTDCHFAVGLGGRDGTAIDMLDGENPNETTRAGDIFADGAKVFIHIQVRVTHIKVVANGEILIDWKGDIRRIGAADWWADLTVGRNLFLAMGQSDFRFDRMVLFPMRSGPEVAEWLAQKKTTYRKWTLENDFGVAEMKLKNFRGDAVIFERRSGKIESVALWRFCEFDVNYIRERFGEGLGSNDLPPEVLQRLSAATVYVEARGGAPYSGRTTGFLFARNDDTGYIAVSGRGLAPWAESPRTFLIGEIKVTFDFGKPTSRIVDAELVTQRPEGIYWDELAILKVTLDDLPEPVDLTDPVPPKEEQTAYVVTIPKWRNVFQPMPQSDKKIVVHKRPMCCIENGSDGLPMAHFRSPVDATPGGIAVTKEGRLLGVVMGGANWIRSAQFLQRYARGEIIEPSAEVIGAQGKATKIALLGRLVGTVLIPRQASALAVPASEVDRGIVAGNEGWTPISAKAKEFKLQIKHDYVGGEIQLSSEQPWIVQLRVTLEDGTVRHGPPLSVDATNAPAHYAWLDGEPAQKPVLEEPENAVKGFTDPVAQGVDLAGESTSLANATVLALNIPAAEIPARMQWSTDNRLLFLLERGGRLRQVELPKFRVVRELQIPSAECTSLAVSQAGVAVLLADQQQIWVMDEKTLTPRRRIHVPQARQFTAIASSPIAFALARADEVFALDLDAGKLLRLFRASQFQNEWLTPMLHGPLPPEWFYDAARTPDGKYLLVCDNARIARLRVDGSDLTYDGGGPNVVHAAQHLVVSPDSQRTMLTMQFGSARFESLPWSLHTMYPFRVEGLMKPTGAMALGPIPGEAAFSASGKYTYANNRSYDLVVFDEQSRHVANIEIVPSGGARQLLPYPRGDRVLVLTRDKVQWVSLTLP